MGNIKVKRALRRRVLDISKWQPGFDGAVAKKQGVSEVVCRLSYGGLKDAKLDAHAASVLGAGLTLSGYTFLTAHYESVNGSSLGTALMLAKQQAQYAVKVAKAVGVDGFIALDLEWESGNAAIFSKAQLTQICNVFLDEVAGAGYPVCLYMSASPMQTAVDIAAIPYPLWVAAYYKYGSALSFDSCGLQGAFPATASGRFMAANAERVMMWQFTSEGYAATYGVTGPAVTDKTGIDKNWAYFEYEGAVAEGGSEETGGTPPTMEGMFTMQALDVFANATAYNGGGGKPFNVQGFHTPSVEDVAMDNIPDGRYMAYGAVPLEGTGLTGVQIRIGGRKVWVALIEDATELTEITIEDAEERFGWFS